MGSRSPLRNGVLEKHFQSKQRTFSIHDPVKHQNRITGFARNKQNLNGRTIQKQKVLLQLNTSKLYPSKCAKAAPLEFSHYPTISPCGTPVKSPGKRLSPYDCFLKLAAHSAYSFPQRNTGCSSKRKDLGSGCIYAHWVRRFEK